MNDMQTTIVAPPSPSVPPPACPYECVRLGVGLRVRDAARLGFLVVATALLAMACACPVEDTKPEPVACITRTESQMLADCVNHVDYAGCVQMSTGPDDTDETHAALVSCLLFPGQGH